jgi:hypothetical protein
VAARAPRVGLAALAVPPAPWIRMGSLTISAACSLRRYG